ncbi:MAG: ABC transporter ATP-binding protein [Firmicutes bacterium]|nr:ABC transporter ATP-binding protein [Bacillota bacterium]
MSKKDENKEYVKLPYFGIPKLLPFLKPYRVKIISMMLMGVLTSAMDIVWPLFTQYAINHYVADSTLQGLPVFILLYVLCLGFQVVMSYISCSYAGQIEMYVGRDLKRESFNHLQNLSFSYFNQNSVGYILARVTSDTGRIGGLVSWDLMDSVWNLSYLIGVIVSMLLLNWKLALIVLTIVPFTALVSVYFQKHLVVLNRKIREINSQISGNFNEGITGAKTTKTLVVEEKMEHDFNATSKEMKDVSVRAARYRSMFGSLISFASYLALALVLWRGGILTLNGLMMIGTLSVFMSYALGMMEPIQWIVRAFSSLITIQVNVERLIRLLTTEPDVKDTPEVIEKYGDSFDPKKENWEPLYGDIEFKDVSFRYPDGDEYVLEHFNLKVPQGTNVAIVGETGAGKSTLVNLVCRFFEPTSGQILIDGRDARERSQLWLHSNIGYVLQTPHLFSGTVKENLLYGKPDATMEQIEDAVHKVSADGVIARMDKGYDSQVGEGGDLLSTGEKQLLSFARAILADPRIFVLDEATSSIDTVTEKLIQDAIESLMKGRTSFVIAHRLSTIRQADVILVVKDGKIIESGTHRELLAKRGYYYDLYTQQYQEENIQSAYQAL